LTKTIKGSKEKRDAASELSNKNTTSVNATDFKDSAMTKRPKSIAISEDVSKLTYNKSEIKESTKMKRLKFKKPFNGVETALKVIPESYKVDNKVFEMTDGNENYFPSESVELSLTVNDNPIINSWKKDTQIPSRNDLSDKISEDLKKRGFKFVGSKIIYAHLQAVGIINDHIVECFRYNEIIKEY